ncbi:nuclear transport factor 2 family protein [Lentiprolixibacter aurantiacus]|uniref:Nuclear transport factor 2 family protein n=1 Tax=Lentiprolixibacter aurantiacus TaxID=2993939 RepID=A0AAE3SP57_9FLAO|nr:nuclear transport factor 2 family protein [Lentiprolixibacter aurantiacus]MCX2720255.1 nuclear transport factor 2 family protein [Lentiprolixibacter aurantiacus]
MPKKIWVFALLSSGLFAQTNTEVFLIPLEITGGKKMVGVARNISNNPGYDNQPSFYNDNVVLFSSNRYGQTDIAGYTRNKKEKTWITDTPGGSEYSPLKIPEKNRISAIRLDNDGLQRLYSYPLEKGKEKELLADLKVGYHVWFDEDIMVCSVLIEDRMDLVVANIKKNTRYTVYKNVGRSLHKIPNSQLVSFTSRDEEGFAIRSLDPVSRANEVITELPEGVQDYCWLPDGTLIAGQQNRLLEFQPGESAEWSQFHRFIRPDIGNISRITVNSKGNLLALVAEASSEIPVQEQLEAYNARDIEKFLEPYAEDVQVYDYPDKLRYVGKETMRKNYSAFFRSTPDLHCELKNRIIIQDKVIDEESVTANGRIFHAVAVYEVRNGKITKVMFVR